MEAFYKAHGEEYSVPEKVRWRLLEIQFERHGGRDKARSVAERALAELRRGDDFKAVVRKYSDGRRIDDKQLSVNRDPATSYSYQASDVTVDSVIGDIGVYGNGCSRIRIEALESQMVSCRADASKPVRLDLTTVRVAGPLDSAIPPKKPRNDDTPRYVEDGKDFWTRPASVADRKLSETLNQLEPGQISGILEGPDSYRIVHLIERNEPPGCRSTKSRTRFARNSPTNCGSNSSTTSTAARRSNRLTIRPPRHKDVSATPRSSHSRESSIYPPGRECRMPCRQLYVPRRGRVFERQTDSHAHAEPWAWHPIHSPAEPVTYNERVLSRFAVPSD